MSTSPIAGEMVLLGAMVLTAHGNPFRPGLYRLNAAVVLRWTIHQSMDYWAVMKTELQDDLSCHPEAHENHFHALRSEQTLARGAELFRALGSPERLQLMERLLDQEHCVSQLAQELSENVTTISQRLQQLHRARLLTKERRGKHIYYSIADHHVRDLLISTFDHVEEERSS